MKSGWKSMILVGLALFAGSVIAEDGESPVFSGDVLTIKVGDYDVDFRGQASWTLGNVKFRGRQILNYTGTNQTVINVQTPSQEGPDTWIGSSHGGEVIESVVLSVDGTEWPLDDAFDATGGREYKLVKKSILGPYNATTETTVTADGVEEVIALEERDPVDSVRYMYVFMHCWNAALTEWMAIVADGSAVGGPFPTERTNLLKSEIAMLALYAPEIGVGAVMSYPEVYPGDSGRMNFISVWPERHNKHYLRVRPDQVRGTTYRCRIQGFEAATDQWKDVARSLAGFVPQTTP